MPVTAAARAYAAKHWNMPQGTADALIESQIHKAFVGESIDLQTLLDITVNAHAIEAKAQGGNKDQHMPTVTNPTAGEMFGGAPAGGENIRVKAESEKYCQKKSIGKHYRTGEALTTDRGQPTELPSACEIAKTGVLIKLWAGRTGRVAPMNDHEKGLLAEMFEKDTWSGELPGEGSNFSAGIPGTRIKALLSDNVSGGINANPEWFDEMVVTFALLSGELFPFVTIMDVPRGSVVQTVSVGNPTVHWGTKSGTEAPIFDTDGLIDPIETSIHPVQTVVEFGRDLLSDAAFNLGDVVVNNIQRSMAAEWDRVIANGNGLDRPEGIFTASGIATVPTVNSTAGPPTLDDYEALFFGIGKQYRNSTCAFIANDTTYARARGIPVSSGSDERRLLGMNYGDYSILSQRFAIQNDIPNNQVAFGDLKQYRLYRRKATETQFIDSDYSLSRANKTAVIVRARAGGRVMNANAFVKAITAQS